jgi:uncharacterized protein YjbI with pentapeptide repeats
MLYKANLRGADVFKATLTRAHLRAADLGDTYVGVRTNLIEANLSGAKPREAGP